MNKVDFLKVMEDIVDNVNIPLSEYLIRVGRTNGDYTLTVCRFDERPIDHMAEWSSIFNDVSDSWLVEYHDNHIHAYII